MSRSIVESEYRRMSNAAAKLMWIQSILFEVGICQLHPPLLLCDNLSATYLATNPVLHNRTKHIEIDHHFIREKVACKQLCVRYVPSENQLADIVTKALPSPRFFNLKTKLTVALAPRALKGG